MKDTRWNWNNWRDVIFKKDGAGFPATPPRPQTPPTAPVSAVDAQARSSRLPRAASGRATPSASGTRTKTGSTCSLAVRRCLHLVPRPILAAKRLLPPSRVAGAGQHILETSPDQMTMSGYRESDNDPCSATRVQ